MEKAFFVYILASMSGVLYVGMTNNLRRRLWEHKQKLVPGFAAKYNCDRLVYYEVLKTAVDAIAREKQIKGYRRAKKVALIVQDNPTWVDISVPS